MNDRRAERLRQLVELAPDGILIHDGELILSVNAATNRLAGATEASPLEGRPVQTLLDPPFLKSVQRQLEGTMSTSAIAPPVRELFHRLDGTSVQVETRAVAFLDGEVPCAHVMIRDITERLALEESARQLALRHQQAERTEAIVTLAGGVAHELNNMLSVIVGSGALALDQPGLPPAAADDVREMLRAADRAAAVTRQLLAFSRHALTRPEVVDLVATLTDAEPGMRSMLGTSRWLTMRLAPVPPVRIDTNQVAQVLTHLVSNARDATAGGGSITLVSATVELFEPLAAAGGREAPPGLYAVLSVRDDGRGISPDDLPRIFDPFFTTKPLGQGTGLGLAAVQGIVAQAGGFITAVSAVGDGTEFTIYLPAIEGTADGLTPVSNAAVSFRAQVAAHREESDGGMGLISLVRAMGPAGTRTVLVVDDEPGVRLVATRALRKAGLLVIEAGDGVEALELIGRFGPPHLVLSDLRMPRMGGIELVRHLRAQWPDLPIIIMSGYSVEYLRLEKVLDLLDDVIQKPFTLPALVQRVRAAMHLNHEAGTTPSG